MFKCFLSQRLKHRGNLYIILYELCDIIRDLINLMYNLLSQTILTPGNHYDCSVKGSQMLYRVRFLYMHVFIKVIANYNYI
jgi:hypothetical protein